MDKRKHPAGCSIPYKQQSQQRSCGPYGAKHRIGNRFLYVQAMFTQPGALETLAPTYEISYLYIGSYERSIEGFDENLFAALPVVFQNQEVTIYQLT